MMILFGVLGIVILLAIIIELIACLKASSRRERLYEQEQENKKEKEDK